MFRILTLNQISAHGLHRFPSARYTVGKAVDEPDAIIVRSHDMRTMAIPASVKAIASASLSPFDARTFSAVRVTSTTRFYAGAHAWLSAVTVSGR